MSILCTKILAEDDAAPDSLEYFAEKFEQRVGMSLEEFQKKAFKVPLKYGFVYSHKTYQLYWYCDDPYYTLYKCTNLTPAGSSKTKGVLTSIKR